MSTEERQYRSPYDDDELRNSLCEWLRENGIDPALVPGDEKPDCTYRPGQGEPIGGHTITIRVRVQPFAGHGAMAIRYGSNRLEEATITMPMKVPPPSLVLTWLTTHCPTCGR